MRIVLFLGVITTWGTVLKGMVLGRLKTTTLKQPEFFKEMANSSLKQETTVAILEYFAN